MPGSSLSAPHEVRFRWYLQVEKRGKRITNTLVGRCSRRANVTFYCRSDVRKACRELLQARKLSAGKNGRAIMNGTVWGPAANLATQLGLEPGTVQRRIKRAKNIPKKRGSDATGKTCWFYPLPRIRALCADLLQELPSASAERTFLMDGETWGTFRVLSDLLRVNAGSVKLHLKNAGVQPIQGKDLIGRVRDYYPLAKARELLPPNLQGRSFSVN